MQDNDVDLSENVISCDNSKEIAMKKEDRQMKRTDRSIKQKTAESILDCICKVGYIRGHQYLESDQPPYTLDKAFEIMTVIQSRDEGASERVAVTAG